MREDMLVAPVKVDLLVTVIEPSLDGLVRSVLSAREAAFFGVTLYEGQRGASDGEDVAPIGRMIFGDVVALRVEQGMLGSSAATGRVLRLVVRRAELVVVAPSDADVARVLEHAVPPELVPLVQRATGSGRLWFSEHAVMPGDALRLRAVVEESGVGSSLVVRADLGPIALETRR